MDKLDTINSQDWIQRFSREVLSNNILEDSNRAFAELFSNLYSPYFLKERAKVDPKL